MLDLPLQIEIGDDMSEDKFLERILIMEEYPAIALATFWGGEFRLFKILPGILISLSCKLR